MACACHLRMTPLHVDQSIANVVLEHSECAAVFQRHRIDFCCRGGLTISDAAKEKGVVVAALMQELEAEIATRNGAERTMDPRELSTPRLVAYIVTKHHEYLRQALPFVCGLASKVRRVHGDHNPKLLELDPAVQELSATLLKHLDEEEALLFPALTTASSTHQAIAPELFASMQTEHLAVGAMLEKIRAAGDDYTLPDWACNSYRTLFAELQQVERDTFVHVHIENHVLQPRFIAS